MAGSSRSAWSWRLAAALVLIAALAQACGGSSQSSGPGGNRVELRFAEVKGARLGLLPTGCSQVSILIQPGNTTVVATDTQVSLLLPAGPHTAVGTLTCGSQTFTSNTAQFEVPPGLGSIDVALVFGGVNVLLTVKVGPGVSVTGDGISCPGDCTQTFFAGTSVKLTANPSTAVFSSGCGGTGSCTVLLNQDKTVVVGLVSNQLGSGSVTVNNEDVEECCDADVTFTPGGIAAISDLEGGDSITRTNVAPGSYVAHVSYFGGECAFQVPFTLDPGENEVLNISPNCLQLRKRR